MEENKKQSLGVYGRYADVFAKSPSKTPAVKKPRKDPNKEMMELISADYAQDKFNRRMRAASNDENKIFQVAEVHKRQIGKVWNVFGTPGYNFIRLDLATKSILISAATVIETVFINGNGWLTKDSFNLYLTNDGFEYQFRFSEKSQCKAAVKILAQKVRVKNLVTNKKVPRVLLTRIEDENKWKSTYLSSERSYKFQNIEEKSTVKKKYKNPDKTICKNVKKLCFIYQAEEKKKVASLLKMRKDTLPEISSDILSDATFPNFISEVEKKLNI